MSIDVQPTSGAAPAQPVKGSGPAVTSLVLGIIAVLLCLLPIINNLAFVLALVGLPFGIVAWRGAKKGRRTGKGMGVAGTVLAVVSLVGVIASQAFYAKVINDVSNDLDKTFGNATEKVLAEDLDVELGSFTATKNMFGHDTALNVTLKNTADEQKSFDIKVEAVDSAGNRIDSDTAYASDLAPGQSDTQKMFEFVAGDDVDQLRSATFKVVEASSY